MCDRFKFRFWNNLSKQYENTYDLKSCGVLDYVIPEQCTGLKDKNGKLIYEGDIVRETSKKEPEWEEYVIAIKWGYCGFNLDSDDEFDFEVIGNIHENPDLLEQSDEI